MKLKSFLMLAAAVIVLVGIAGCREGFSFKTGSLFKKPSTEAISPDYHSGYGSVDMKFMQNAPPSEIYEGSTFPIRLELRNRGAYDIGEGEIFLFNYNNPKEMMVSGDITKMFSLEGRSADNPDGGYDVVEFEAFSKKAPQLQRLSFAVDACYWYGTDAVIPVCINPYTSDIAGLGRRGCQIRPVSTSGQGGPVAVTRIEPKVVPQSGDKFKMTFKITLDNKGNGKVREPEKCSGKPVVFMGVEVSDLRTSDSSLSCKGLGDVSNLTESFNLPESETAGAPLNHYFVLKENEDNVIFCDAEFDRSLGSFITPVIVNMQYFYSTSVDKTIRVRKFE